MQALQVGMEGSKYALHSGSTLLLSACMVSVAGTVVGELKTVVILPLGGDLVDMDKSKVWLISHALLFISFIPSC